MHILAHTHARLIWGFASELFADIQLIAIVKLYWNASFMLDFIHTTLTLIMWQSSTTRRCECNAVMRDQCTTSVNYAVQQTVAWLRSLLLLLNYPFYRSFTRLGWTPIAGQLPVASEGEQLVNDSFYYPLRHIPPNPIVAQPTNCDEFQQKLQWPKGEFGAHVHVWLSFKCTKRYVQISK